MITYFPYDPENPQSVVGEQHTIERGQIRLRHVPTEHSIQIEGFSEIPSPAALHLNEFACLYSRETGYREANRIVYFSSAHNGLTVYVNYLACGTPLTADDANEIKNHIDSSAEKELLNEVSHRQFSNDILDLRNAATVEQTARIKADNEINSRLETIASSLKFPIASASCLGVIKVGDGLEITSDGVLNVTGGGGTVPAPTIQPEGMDFLTYVFRNRPPAEYNSLGKQDFLSYVFANDTPTIYSESGGVSKADFIDYVFGGASNG